MYSLLAKVYLLVPFPPDLRRSKHATRSAHVTESSLSSTVSSSSRDTGNTSNSTTWVNIISHFPYDTHSTLFISPFPHRRSSNLLNFLQNPSKCLLTSTPRLSRSLVTSLLAHGIWLTLILGHSSVYCLNDIRSDRRGEDLYNSNQHISSTLHQQIFPSCRTFGRGWVTPLAVPSADRMVTVGREAISRD
jgi:hypothetical protein